MNALRSRTILTGADQFNSLNVHTSDTILITNTAFVILDFGAPHTNESKLPDSLKARLMIGKHSLG